MERKSEARGIILNTRIIGDQHRGLDIATASRGIIHPIAYGANSIKGKLRGSSNPFTLAVFRLYEDPVKRSLKVTEIDVINDFQGFREKIERFFVASVWAEILLKTEISGGMEESYYHFERSLSLLHELPDEQVAALNLKFLWTFVDFLGLQVDFRSCDHCGRGMEREEPRYFLESSHEIICDSCHRQVSEAGRPLNQGFLSWIVHTAQLSTDESSKIKLSKESKQSGLLWLIDFIQYQLSRELKAFRSGKAILMNL